MKNKSIIDKYKGSGKSFAEISEEISKKYPRRDYNLLEKKSFEQELKLLQEQQEIMKLNENMKNVFKYGGMLKKKYENGSVLTDPETNPTNTDPKTKLPDPERLQIWSDKLPIGVMKWMSEQDKKNTVTSTSQKSDEKQTDTGKSAYTPALIGQGISTALNLGILAKGYDKSDPATNPFESQALRQLQERGIDTTEQRNQIMSAFNAGRQNLQNVRSANVRNALEANLMNVTGEQLAKSKMAEQAQNLQYKGDLANALGSFGQQRAQARLAAEELTARDKGQFLSNLSALGASTAESAKFFTEKNLNKINNDLLLKILSEKYTMFRTNPELGKRLAEGKVTEKDLVELQELFGENTGMILDKFEIPKSTTETTTETKNKKSENNTN